MNRRSLLLTMGSAVGYGLGLAALVMAIANDGGRGYDAHAYWVAARNVLEGHSLYGPAHIGGLGAFWYPPVFAQLWAPFGLLPELAFTWLWRAVCFLSLRYLAGSWRAVGLWMLLPLTITELSSANVTLPVAAGTFAALRGDVRALPWAALLKIGPALCLPYLWRVRPETRVPLVRALLIAFAVCLISFATLPGEWFSYASHLISSTGIGNTGNGLVAVLPNPVADFALRLGAAIGLVFFASAFRSDRAVFVATVIAVPTLWVARLVPLLAVPRLPGRATTTALRAVAAKMPQGIGTR